MIARGGEVDARLRAVDFRKPFRPAADGTNSLLEGWTKSFFLPRTAQGTGHRLVAHYNLAVFFEKLCGISLALATGCERRCRCRRRNMAEALVRNESPAEYFKELVETAIEHQHIAVRDLTSFYLVNLLTGFVQFDRTSTAAPDEPLGIRLARALQA